MNRRLKDVPFSPRLISACLEFENRGFVKEASLLAVREELQAYDGEFDFQSMHEITKAVYRELFLRAHAPT